ncbi:DUF2332 domain-containing protein [Alkalihalophilus lindianensis]|uniref:DUF2332 domain-containing protein n=1 Tax=Alkalihalophilus lindianensis TaxID=1630542 RepID=A0ABU3XDK8_9BACI|nr:DUF2332 domain-containing protein [Alkalihalophilus lindianensis]MDV2685975.1 DUF2332 domain-containing protein [Alkalihalophilus lindianensis]
MDINQLSKRFIIFANVECAGRSVLYETLSKEIAKDEALLTLCSHARAGQPVPNLLFGAVHYLLLSGEKDVLADYYPSLVAQPKRTKEAFIPFKTFCENHKEQIQTLLQTKLVQTNEVRRCSYLYPSFSAIYEKAKRPLALIEIGTSAGLQLLWDYYRYSYEETEEFGNLNSPVHIHSQVKGENVPALLKDRPQIEARYGIDLHINDLTNEDDYLWLKALIWPEQHTRRALFDAAAMCVAENKESLHLIEGDGVELLPSIVADISDDAAICVFHTHVANQMPQEVKQRLQVTIKEIGQRRDIYHLYNNMSDGDLHLDSYQNGTFQSERVAETDGHGEWFSWKRSSKVTS